MQTEPKQTGLLVIPDKIEVNETFSKLTISYRWLNSYSYFLLIGMFIIFTIVITTLWDSFVSTSLFKELLDAPTFKLLVVAMFASTGIYYAYYALCSVLNKTIVEVDGHAIKIWFEPLPWIGSDKILRADIKQLYTTQHVKARGNRWNSSISISYRVKAVTQSNQNILLVQDIDTAEQARFLERKIEQYLGITNEKVEGEYVNGIEEPKAWFGDWHL